MKSYQLIIVLCILFASCEKQFERGFENTPINNFEIFWNEFDRYYSYFDYKNVDWDSLYTVFKPKITSNTSDNELLNMKILSLYDFENF